MRKNLMWLVLVSQVGFAAPAHRPFQKDIADDNLLKGGKMRFFKEAPSAALSSIADPCEPTRSVGGAGFDYGNVVPPQSAVVPAPFGQQPAPVATPVDSGSKPNPTPSVASNEASQGNIQQGKAKFDATCAKCHSEGKNFKSTEQLLAFAQNPKQPVGNAAMSQAISKLSDEDFKNIAAYLQSKR